MPIVINELAATIQPRPETVSTQTVRGTGGTAEEAVRRVLAQLRLAEEREKRLAVD